MDSSDPPIMAAEVQKVEPTRNKDLITGPIRGFCAYTPSRASQAKSKKDLLTGRIRVSVPFRVSV